MDDKFSLGRATEEANEGGMSTQRPHQTWETDQ